MVEPGHRSAEQQAGERRHRQVGPGEARPLLSLPPINLQLGIVRVGTLSRLLWLR
jgi:hypothetical protein